MRRPAPTRRGRLARASLLSMTLALVVAAPLASHDFWLIPDAFRIASGDRLEVSGQTSSSFPTTLSAVTVDRVAEARLVTATGSEPTEDLSTRGNSLRLAHRPSTPGQALVAVRIHPRSIPESPESFRNYLTLEGAPEALERYEREGLMPTDSIVRRYAKYAKTLVHVGSGGSTAYDRHLGHPLEFVPLDDPEAVGAGGILRFRLLLLGEPIAGARGHASAAAHRDAEHESGHATWETDRSGEISVEVTTPGIWNVRALYILPAPAGSGADWDVHWATFVWEVAGDG